jgi:hypothetical protein
VREVAESAQEAPIPSPGEQFAELGWICPGSYDSIVNIESFIQMGAFYGRSACLEPTLQAYPNDVELLTAVEEGEMARTVLPSAFACCSACSSSSLHQLKE